jgi:hypothetical protein
MWKRLSLLIVGLAVCSAGCALGRKPYADDPLIRGNRAVWGDREKAAKPDPNPPPEPVLPPPPGGPLIGMPTIVSN